MYKISEVADLAGVSVRTLHYYDKIDLLKPTLIEENGYRLYDDENLARLHQILFFKEMEFSLNEIKEILDDPHFNQKKALLSHKEILKEKRKRLDKIIRSIDQTISTIEGGKNMTKKEMFEPFDMSQIEEQQKKYEEEVRRKYAGTTAYQESQRKTKSYGAEDWQNIEKERTTIYKEIANRMEQGPDDKEVQQLVEKWKNHITAHFYECNLEILRGLGEMYIADDRFMANIDQTRPGLAKFLSEAIQVYCDRQEKAL